MAGANKINSKGNRMISWGRNTFRSQVSAIGYQIRIFRYRIRRRAICHLTSVIDSAL